MTFVTLKMQISTLIFMFMDEKQIFSKFKDEKQTF